MSEGYYDSGTPAITDAQMHGQNHRAQVDRYMPLSSIGGQMHKIQTTTTIHFSTQFHHSRHYQCGISEQQCASNVDNATGSSPATKAH